MSDLIEIQGQIEKLQKQASDIKAREFGKTVQDILARMKAFGITLKDLQPGKAHAGKGKPKTARAKGTAKTAGTGGPKRIVGPVAAKYRGPNGEVWSGRGLTPRWLTALSINGKTKQDFAIKG